MDVDRPMSTASVTSPDQAGVGSGSHASCKDPHRANCPRAEPEQNSPAETELDEDDEDESTLKAKASVLVEVSVETLPQLFPVMPGPQPSGTFKEAILFKQRRAFLTTSPHSWPERCQKRRNIMKVFKNDIPYKAFNHERPRGMRDRDSEPMSPNPEEPCAKRVWEKRFHDFKSGVKAWYNERHEVSYY
jgi:hypothetical protein